MAQTKTTAAGAASELQLPMTYGDHMVLQRDTPLELHGRAAAGQYVTISLQDAQHVQRRKIRADYKGFWMVKFPPQHAGGPYTLTFEAGRTKKSFTDVWVGEVWLCSGQSNMELTLASIATAKTDIAAADTVSRLHLFGMPGPWPIYAQVWSQSIIDSIDSGKMRQEGAWQRCSSQSAPSFSAIGFHFGRMLADSLGCHVGIMCNAVGGSTTEGWIDTTSLRREVPEILEGDWRKNPNIMEWARHRADYNLQKADASVAHRHPYAPAFLFEAALRPLERYGVKGVVWYQGESNADLPRMHERLFPLLEKSWRKELLNPRLPFITIQLSGISTRPSWPEFRNSQRLLADSLPHTWMVVCSDLGDSLNVHPTRKAPVGERSALAALHHVYDFKHVVSAGPSPLSMTEREGEAVVAFSNSDAMQAADGKRIKGFELAGADGVFHPATKVQVVGATIHLTSDSVPHPVRVRYAWQPYPDANLVNRQQLPCSTFELSVKAGNK